MEDKYLKLLKNKCDESNYDKLAALNNPRLYEFIAKYVQLCNPKSVFVRNGSPEDIQYIRDKAVELKEENRLKIEGHTYHFDGINDQGRDKEVTKFLVTKEMDLGSGLNTLDRQTGLDEMYGLMKNIMDGREMFVLFMCLGPINSDFSIYAVQLTDSAYVSHSEDILYRGAYAVFKQKGPDIEFFKYVHSSGELENYVSKNVDRKRIYIDFVENIVYSVNTQYAGNTVGLKKLSLRLAIRKSDRENWLAEHMLVMAVHGPKDRKTYFTGAFPSFCGKTATCMVKGEEILGDDIAYLRKRDKSVYAVNVERGIFGIVKDVNAKDDPLIWQALTTSGEVIFSNVLIKDGTPYWQGDGRPAPDGGINYSGKWTKDKVDAEGNPVSCSHPNARYTIRLDSLKNCDARLEDPQGVLVEGVIYGGRDSDTWPPVFESFDWAHGVATIASSLESETTAATLGKTGIRNFNLMANLDFLSIPIGRYIQNHLKFTEGLKEIPVIFGVNYFLKDQQGNYLTGMQDKRVWLKWMELRIHKDADAIKTPIGFLPKYQDLKVLFKELLDKNYTNEDYLKQFTLRIPQNIAKTERILEIFKTKAPDVPTILFKILQEQHKRLKEAQAVCNK